MAPPGGSRWAPAGTGDAQARRHLEVSQRLRERRRLLGLTQKQVISRLARLGVASTNKSLSSLEHGAGLDVAKLPELAAALDCTVTWLLGLTDDPHRWEPDASTPAGADPAASARSRSGPGRAPLAGHTAYPANAAGHDAAPDTRFGDASHSPHPARRPEPSAPRRSAERASGPWILGPLSPEP